MEIGITEATRKFLGLKPLPAPSEENPFLCWGLVRADCGGRKLLVMSNASNRLSAVSTMTGADWKKLPQLIPGLVRGAIMFSEPAID